MFEKMAKEKQNRIHGGVILGLVVLALISAAAARGENRPLSWNATLFGGGILGHNGDAGRFIREYERYYQTWAEAYQTSKSGSLDWPGIGMEFGGEIGYALSSRLKAGLAIERLSKKMEDSLALGSGTTHFMDMKMSALSISALGSYSVPLTQAVSIAFRAGLGVLFGSWDRVLRRQFPNTGDEQVITGEYSASGMTGQASFGLTWDLTPRIALQLEGGYRLAPLSNWSGKNTYTMGPQTEETRGDLNYLELQGDERNPAVYHPSLAVGDPHIVQGLVTYQACKAGFSGFRLKAGFVVRFGL